ncbi:GNAT family N-acetyltransferase [Pseudomonas sp. BGr12]|uniref:GNAT family N-acetyltransferase n=2 Tax=Pseudomonadaceae TaxID=135621 RepID=A0A5R8ZSX4_PSENT|nr:MULTISPECIES: GNAT family N-acetyltransferase [Pseudomonadaceae]MBD9500659.1 GNAT family N-acetyltransferase [Pseudomonas sp. PDM17]MBD9630021.1 GNAT family N-acetyltransferase [Pseudomonas sp. PDM19]MDL2430837.1 GNAT family N-acetyltransferase [Pseudomonas sp. BJa5]QEY72062.1 GNAT family N-acetyltransferase [Pseudomonas denitrificans (nom. rej.)]TLP68687.1 GNAT family N-acetyltransferase [Pseudomonas nitroreducens]
MADLQIRPATADDVPAMLDLIFEHGPNDWNFLPEGPVREHFQGIAAGTVWALVAVDGDELRGLVTFHESAAFGRFQHEGRPRHAYIAEATVHRGEAGRGLGTRLLRAAIADLLARGLPDIYIERHEENPGSAGMMRKAGFDELETFADPQRRPNGSRRTTICYLDARTGAA